jgi:hypothetical protein
LTASVKFVLKAIKQSLMDQAGYFYIEVGDTKEKPMR